MLSRRKSLKELRESLKKLVESKIPKEEKQKEEKQKEEKQQDAGTLVKLSALITDEILQKIINWPEYKAGIFTSTKDAVDAHLSCFEKFQEHYQRLKRNGYDEIADLFLLCELTNYQDELRAKIESLSSEKKSLNDDELRAKAQPFSSEKNSLNNIAQDIANDNSFTTLDELELCCRAYVALLEPTNEDNMRGVSDLLPVLNKPVTVKCKRLLYALLVIACVVLLVFITKGTTLPLLGKILGDAACVVGGGVSSYRLFKQTAADKASKLHDSLNEQQESKQSKPGLI